MKTALKQATIVIVDDDPSIAHITSEFLRVRGVLHLHYFRDVTSTLMFVDETAELIDLFLIDLHMPGQTGYDLVAQLHLMPKVAQAKKVALTAGVLFTDIRQAKAAKFDAFIGKPIKFQEFDNQVSRILAGESLWEWL